MKPKIHFQQDKPAESWKQEWDRKVCYTKAEPGLRILSKNSLLLSSQSLNAACTQWAKGKKLSQEWFKIAVPDKQKTHQLLYERKDRQTNKPSWLSPFTQWEKTKYYWVGKFFLPWYWTSCFPELSFDCIWLSDPCWSSLWWHNFSLDQSCETSGGPGNVAT